MKKLSTHTITICTIKLTERTPDLTAAAMMKLTQIIKQKHKLKERIETKLNKAKKDQRLH